MRAPLFQLAATDGRRRERIGRRPRRLANRSSPSRGLQGGRLGVQKSCWARVERVRSRGCAVTPAEVAVGGAFGLVPSGEAALCFSSALERGLWMRVVVPCSTPARGAQGGGRRARWVLGGLLRWWLRTSTFLPEEWGWGRAREELRRGSARTDWGPPTRSRSPGPSRADRARVTDSLTLVARCFKFYHSHHGRGTAT